MKKMKLALLTLAVSVAISSTAVLAANSTSTPSPTPKAKAERTVDLTDAQKKEVQDIQAQIDALHKQMIDKYQSYGKLTKEQADAMKARIDERAKNMAEKGFLPGLGHGHGKMGCKGFGGRGFGGKFKGGMPKVPSATPQASTVQ